VGYFVIKQEIPPNTPPGQPVEVTIEVQNRIVTRKEVLFPMNAAMLAGIQLCDRQGIFWPSPGSPSQWITGDNDKSESTSSVVLSGSPYLIKARMYNEDNTFPRTPEIHIEVEDTSIQILLQQLIETVGEALRRLAK
jgi:hypothetical protein